MESTTKNEERVASTAQWAGTGTSNDPYQLTTPNDLKALATWVDQGKATQNCSFIVTNDIDMKGITDFIPIGNFKNAFQGKFNGNQKKISNIVIHQDIQDKNSGRAALFGRLKGEEDNYTEIKNLTIENIDLQAYFYVGGLSGDMEFASVEYVTVTGLVTAAEVSGGLFGIAKNSIIKNSHTNMTVNVDRFGGGFCGENSLQNSISLCSAKGHCNGQETIGGFCGINGGTITQSSFKGTQVTGTNTIGGFCGKNAEATIDQCFVTQTRILAHWYVGGFCGENYGGGQINNSYAETTIYADDYVGGFCGKNDYIGSLIQNSYAIGELIVTTVKGKTTGGFEGIETNLASIKNVYRETSMESHNNKGTAISAENMKKSTFVNQLNMDQSTNPWKTDYADPQKANNGFPILNFQDPINPNRSIDVTTTVIYGDHSRGSKYYPAKIIGSYTVHYCQVESKGFLVKKSTDKEWDTELIYDDKFYINTSVTTTYYEYQAFATDEFGKTYYGEIISIGTAY
ncbi:MAG: hypothetical protein EOM31_05685 [Bacteroidia bacterium]|nr:hypothetical protein [Bacteroidia bacterium]